MLQRMSDRKNRVALGLAMSWLGAILLSGCEGSEFTAKSGMSKEDPPSEDANPIEEGPGIDANDGEPDPPDNDGGEIGPPPGEVKLNLKVGEIKTTAKTDYLLVVDNSVSMDAYLERVFQGFESLAPEDFTADHRIAAISTMAASYDDPERLHDGINIRYPLLAKEPGYLALKNRANITSFLAELAVADSAVFNRPTKAAVEAGFANLGCDSSWVKIGDKNPEGKSCLQSLLQIGSSGVGCEPGINALGQFLEKMASDPGLFRRDAALNVIFISDEYSPGCSDADLDAAFEATCKTAEQLTTFVQQTWGLEKVVFNGIVSDNEMNSTRDCSYKKLAGDSAGVLVKMDNPAEYKNAILQILDTKQTSDERVHEFKTDVEVKKITIDGREHSQFKLTGRLLKITGLKDLPLTAKIEIDYIELGP